MSEKKFTGYGAVITGGARGIGFAAAQRLALEGAQVSLWDRDQAALDKAKAALGVATVDTRVVELTDYAQVEMAAKESAKFLGKIDILVNNAGIAGANHTVWDYPVEEWREVIDVDLNGVFYCCKAMVKDMLDRGYGRIVNIASIAGKEGNPNASPYSAAKAGVIGLTKSLGKETAGTGVTVNCITPAAIKTDIFDQISQQHIDYMLSKIPMGRFGQVEEIAAMIAWIASAECSFTTAAVFDLSGGRATY